MLAVFTALTIPLVHPFWSMERAEALAHFYTATEHVTVIGALMVMAILSHRTKASARRAEAIRGPRSINRRQDGLKLRATPPRHQKGRAAISPDGLQHVSRVLLNFQWRKSASPCSSIS